MVQDAKEEDDPDKRASTEEKKQHGWDMLRDVSLFSISLNYMKTKIR